MPITEADQAFIHIQVIDDDHFNCIVYARNQAAPFNFEAKIIYHYIRTGPTSDDFVVSEVEYL